MSDPAKFGDILQPTVNLVELVQNVPHADVIRNGPRPRLSGATRGIVLYRDNYQCRWCGSTRQLEIDHIKPWSAGGSDEIENLRVLCHSCNEIRSNRWRAGEEADPDA